MKTFTLLLSVFLVFSCSKHVDYTPEFMDQTSGRYLYTPDEVFEIYYKDNELFLAWRGVENIKPVIIDQHTFFVADMYKKLRFVEHPKTKERYLSIVNPDNEEAITYDYLKLSDTSFIPSEHLAKGNFDKALDGFLEIKNHDSTKVLIAESDINALGYRYLRDEKYQDAIEVFKINVALYPESSNVYDSLADAYVRSGDSVQAFTNYQKALGLDKENTRAKLYVDTYKKKSD